MAITQTTRNFLFFRAGGQCECNMIHCNHRFPRSRCNKPLVMGWHAHHVNRFGPDIPSNLLAMCPECHANTPSYGKHW